jgi:D-arabinose 1-dehydrogenase-like Zn-dependent alcohol dehydrogenase
MRAAILEKPDATPSLGEFQDPTDHVVDVRLAGCNPVDLALAAGRMGTPPTPSVVGKEGIGANADGQRMYFDSPPAPFGSWAQRCSVDPDRTFPIPDAVDDDLAVALGIAGLAAWLPLTRHSDVSNAPVGEGAGSSADVPFRALAGRTHVGHLNDDMPSEVLRTGYEELMQHAAAGRIQVETRIYPLDQAVEAWRAQSEGPHVKIAVAP